MKRFFLTSLIVLALAGCGDLRQTLGLIRTPPDAFAVVSNPPLTLPPEFHLRPPQPGEQPANIADPVQQGQQAMFGENAIMPQSQPDIVRQSTGELVLLDQIDHPKPARSTAVMADEVQETEATQTLPDQTIISRPDITDQILKGR